MTIDTFAAKKMDEYAAQEKASRNTAQARKDSEEKSKGWATDGPCYGELKKIDVVAAIIQRGREVFATQRGYGSYKDWWEFPGGKVEPGETPEEALTREIREELTADISVGEYLTTVEYDYPEFHLSMTCYWCRVKEGHLTLLEHEAARWLPLNDLRQVNWLPADILVIEAIENAVKEPDHRDSEYDRC